MGRLVGGELENIGLGKSRGKRWGEVKLFLMSVIAEV